MGGAAQHEAATGPRLVRGAPGLQPGGASEAPWLGICGVQTFLSFQSFLVLLQTVFLQLSLWFNFLDQSWKIIPSKLSVITLFKAHFESHILSLTP